MKIADLIVALHKPRGVYDGGAVRQLLPLAQRGVAGLVARDNVRDLAVGKIA
jgi:hypothetical protein